MLVPSATAPAGDGDRGKASTPDGVPEPTGLDAFVEAVANVGDPMDPEGFWTCREPFRALLRSDFLNALLRGQLECCVSGTGQLIEAGSGSSARLSLPNGMQLNILLVEPGDAPDELMGYPSHVLIGFRAARTEARMTIERYRHLAGYRNEVFDPDAHLLRDPDEVLWPGDVTEVAAGSEVFRRLSVDRPVTYIILQSKPFLQFAWQYDGLTLKPRHAICHDSTTYRLFYTTKLLQEIAAPGNVESLLRISEHESHFVRWSALQALCANDRAAALERLARAADDPHPRVREAARKALVRLIPNGESPWP